MNKGLFRKEIILCGVGCQILCATLPGSRNPPIDTISRHRLRMIIPFSPVIERRGMAVG